MFGIEESIGNGEDCRFQIVDCGFGTGHVAAPSLGQYASLSFVVIGRKQDRLIRELENSFESRLESRSHRTTDYHFNRAIPYQDRGFLT